MSEISGFDINFFINQGFNFIIANYPLPKNVKIYSISIKYFMA